ncbi:MAG TPA: hypothetical protein VN706_25065 [Gemmatimonadaceae bacterium]|nr:hypothetical protein [Gemmatimonadaceae bacterium]
MSIEPSAREIERVEGEAWTKLLFATPNKFRERHGIQVHRGGAVVTLLASRADVATINRTIGLGLEQPLTDDELRRVTASYVDAGVPRWLIEWTPGAQPSDVAELLSRYGGTLRSPTVKFWRAIGDDLPNAETPLDIVEIDASHAAEFQATVAPPLGVPSDISPMIASAVGDDGWHYYLARDGDRAVAGAAMFVHGRAAWMGIAGTAADARGRGAQSALIARRVRDAGRLGCDWVSADTSVDTAERPNPSYRNMQRAGLRPLYHRAKYLFELTSAKSLLAARSIQHQTNEHE